MKYTRTTINLPHTLLRDAKMFALEHDTTLTQVIEQSLHRTLEQKIPPQKQSFADYLDTYTPAVTPLSETEQDTRYRDALMEKYG